MLAIQWLCIEICVVLNFRATCICAACFPRLVGEFYLYQFSR
jgi:hypothetical protein